MRGVSIPLIFKTAALGLTLVLGCAFAAATGGFSDNESVSRWMSTYYRSPEPQRLREAVSRFIGDPARLTHPERLDAPAHFFGVVAASDRQAQQDLKSWASTLPAGAGKQFVERVLRQTGRIAFQRPGDPNDLDILWAHFAATGSIDAARLVLRSLDFQPQDVDLKRPVWQAMNITNALEGARLMRGAAAWSLSKHAQSQPAVKQLVEAELASATSDSQRARLQGILDGKISLK